MPARSQRKIRRDINRLRDLIAKPAEQRRTCSMKTGARTKKPASKAPESA